MGISLLIFIWIELSGPWTAILPQPLLDHELARSLQADERPRSGAGRHHGEDVGVFDDAGEKAAVPIDDGGGGNRGGKVGRDGEGQRTARHGQRDGAASLDLEELEGMLAGPDPDVYWNTNAPGTPYTDERIELLGFVRDVAPLYAQCSLVIVPTKVSAGTNLKVLEAMAMERAVVSTTSGCAGLGLVHGESVWIADSAEEFAAGIETLLTDYALRHRIAAAARGRAQQHFDWKQIGLVQRQLWNELLDSSGLILRPGRESDLTDVARIQATASTASHWDPETYLTYHLWVAERDGAIAGFAVHRSLDEEEMELLNLAVDPAHRRSGVATRLIGNIDSPSILLEVRESNLEAQRLYQKLGFVEIGRREKYYTEPDETAIVMRLSQRLKRVKV